jgi:hypothetical protein
MTVELPGIAQAEWVHPNESDAGYYRWSLAPVLNARLARRATALRPRERVGLLDNASALLNAGELAGDEYLTVLAAFGGDPEPEIIQKVAAQLGVVRSTLLRAEQRESFNAFSRSLLRPALTRLGLQPAAGEPEHVSPLRSDLLGELGREGRDPEVLALARELTRRYLAEPSEVDSALVDAALRVAGYQGDLALWESLRIAFEQAKSPVHRTRLLDALGGVRDEAAVVRALDYALHGSLNATEFIRIPRELAKLRDQRDRVIDWLIQHHDAIKARMPEFFYIRLITLAEGEDAAVFGRLREFLLEPARRADDAAPEITKATERMAHRALLLQKESANVMRFLNSWSAKPPADR